MGLSNELISQFVKVTNDKQTVKKETTVYGTVKEYNDSLYVQLDGSELLTPVSTTTNAKVGERVAVTIKNHTATVTGNLSSPAARTDDVKDVDNKVLNVEKVVAEKVDTKVLEAEKARIDNLEADNVDIHGTLTAQNGKIETLEANDVKINGTLTAQSGKIETLEADNVEIKNSLEAANAVIYNLDSTYATIKNLDATNAEIDNLRVTQGNFEQVTTENLAAVNATINNLDTKYATIDDLKATNAEVDILDAGVAKIDTLIFGSASGDVIQTNFANAVIAQLGDAQIKSAMIQNVDASKINAGTINTNNVNVQSDDGKFLISDETMQISDDTRVRVQIGKDAYGDYSINIWDADGKLMFSEGGITDSAIKEAIIRNDMVSENANISASKLDISSLFTEINGSTETIKSNRIYLDEENQTLDLSFKQMSSDVSGLSDTVSSQGTDISVMQGQIESKVWQQDINAATGEMNTKYSALEQTVNSISATVADHTTEISKKADNTTVTTINNKVSDLELDVDGFKTTVSDTYATKTALASTDSKASNAATAAANAQSDIVAVSERVTKTETSIESNATEISLRATKTEVTKDIATAKSEAISTASSDATNKANAALESANKNTSDLLTNYSTTTEMVSKIESEIKSSADSINLSVRETYATKTALSDTDKKASDAQADIDNLDIGGRNYFKSSEVVDLGCTGGASGQYSLTSTGSCIGFYISTTAGDVWTLSRAFISSNRFDYCFAIDEPANGTKVYEWDSNHREDLKIEGIIVPEGYNYLFLYLSSDASVDSVDTIKLEKGNRATDWTPNPDDIFSEINILKDSIVSTVKDENGNVTALVQTGSGWDFQLGPLDGLPDKVDGLDTTVNELKEKTDHIKATTVDEIIDDETINQLPALVLFESKLKPGETGFKSIFTNKYLNFIYSVKKEDGTTDETIPTRVTTTGMETDDMTIDKDLNHVGFRWRKRANGNYGLSWIGGDE